MFSPFFPVIWNEICYISCKHYRFVPVIRNFMLYITDFLMKQFSLFFLLLAFGLFTASCEGLGEDGLTEAEIVAGLKEALQVGTDTSVTKTNKENGYYNDSRIRIPSPPEAANVISTVSGITFLGQPVGQTAVDGFILKLNRAAENASDKAKPIFVNAITSMTITDGLNILQGPDDAATQYLNTNTYESLKTAFKPDIATSLDQVGAQTAWNEIVTLYNTVSSNPVNPDLADFTTGKALDGLFTLIADEELKIRTDPVARVTDILSKVFGTLD